MAKITKTIKDITITECCDSINISFKNEGDSYSTSQRFNKNLINKEMLYCLISIDDSKLERFIDMYQENIKEEYLRNKNYINEWYKKYQKEDNK